MSERKATGGAKEFSYTNEDMQRIRSTDTSSTKAFKEGYKKWQEQRIIEKAEEERFAKQRRNMIILLLLLFGALIVLIFLKFR
jgi:hypothetical protein